MLLTQTEMAIKIGVSRCTYADIESDRREGTLTFWRKLQSAFNIPSDKMWELTESE